MKMIGGAPSPLPLRLFWVYCFVLLHLCFITTCTSVSVLRNTGVTSTVGGVLRGPRRRASPPHGLSFIATAGRSVGGYLSHQLSSSVWGPPGRPQPFPGGPCLGVPRVFSSRERHREPSLGAPRSSPARGALCLCAGPPRQWQQQAASVQQTQGRLAAAAAATTAAVKRLVGPWGPPTAAAVRAATQGPQKLLGFLCRGPRSDSTVMASKRAVALPR